MPPVPQSPAPLKFKVAPHIVEDLGLNLYTSLPRVLVEFVANAYDADSPSVDITMDKAAIRAAREVLKKEFELDKARAGSTVAPLETRTLPGNLTISIEDAGGGMSRDDLNKKFLVAGRRRRIEEKEAPATTAKGRAIMGRKGLGKLAGFGVAKVVEVITKTAGEKRATKITLDYDQLITHASVHEIDVPETVLPDNGGIKTSGTRIVLSKLLYDPLKSRPATIESEIADHFALIEPSDFAVRLNGKQIEPAKPTLVYAWPRPDDLPFDEFVEAEIMR